ncbi:MAG TPA: hypothetical protein VF774_25505 [Pseudoduganella sp.]
MTTHVVTERLLPFVLHAIRCFNAAAFAALAFFYFASYCLPGLSTGRLELATIAADASPR